MNTSYDEVANLSSAEKRALLEKLMREKAKEPRLYPLSFSQQRLWFLDKLQPECAAYNIPAVVRLTGKIAYDSFRKGLDAVVERHEALRTVFVEKDDTPWQEVKPPTPAEFHIVDLRQMDEASRREEMDRIIFEEVRRTFDLSRDLMIGATLLKLGEEEHVLVLVSHHIASDEWSLRILFQEWAAYYRAFEEGGEADLQDLPIQYREFAQWQREWMQGEVYQEQLSYWREHLKGPLPVLQLPADFPRPAAQTYNGALHGRMIPKELIDSVKQFSREERATLFMTLLAAFKVLLNKYTGQEEIIVGCPIAGRNRLETEPLIGFFVNTLALRSSLAGNPTFRELLRRVRESTLGAYANQDMPFEKLVEELHPERSSTHTPFVQAVFSLNNEFVEPEVFPGIKSEEIEVDTGTSKFDITVIAKDSERGLNVVIEYNTDLFSRERIDRMLHHFETLLREITTRKEARISELEILAEREREMILRGWNETATDYPRGKTIHQLFEAQVARQPEAVAAQFGSETLSYRELNARANQLAHRLQRMRVGPGTLVGVYMERSAEMIVAFLAILKAGGAYVPLDLSYPKERLAFMIEDTRMGVILSESAQAGDLPKNGAEVLCLDRDRGAISDEPRQLAPSQAAADSIAYVIYTSGSTGMPKGVVVPHRGVTRLVLNTDYIRLNETDRVAQASNASFDAATFEIWGALLNGARLVGINRDVSLSPAEFAETLRREKITSLFLTTALFNQIAREAPGAFGTLRHVLFGGEAVDPKWVRAVLEYQPPNRLLHVYGPTENTTFSTWHLVEDVPEDGRTIPIGKPISNTVLYILDPNGNPVPAGVAGEIYVGGDGLALGYWNRPEQTAEKFVENRFAGDGPSRLYRTGDLARFDDDGNVEFIGRVDHQVKIRGFRIELGEIESLLARHPGVSNAVVMAREDVPGDRRLVAYLVSKGTAPSRAELQAHLREQLPEYMVPAVFVFMNQFPHTPNGKVDRKALPQPDQNRPELNKSFIAPRDSVEQQLAKVWEKVLGVQPIGVADNFFDLGGHSLLAVRLFSQIEKAFNKKLPLATLFRAPTIEEIANVLREKTAVKNWSTIVDIQPKGSKPPFFWIHSLGGDGGGGFFYYRKLAELLGPDQPSFGVRSPEEPFDRIEDMAAFYVSELRKSQPEGPYYLGGFCFGGNVAFEMAQQLTALGEEVALLVMLETSPPNLDQKQSWSATAAKYSIENLLENVKDFVHHSPQDRLTMLKQKSQRLTKKIRNKIAPPSEDAKPAELSDVMDLTNYPKDYVKYAETHWQALTRYKPKPYAGEITLFRAKKQGLTNFNHTLGWEALVDGRVEVTVIPGTHESMLQEPNVQIIATELKKLLIDAQSKHIRGRHELLSA